MNFGQINIFSSSRSIVVKGSRAGNKVRPIRAKRDSDEPYDRLSGIGDSYAEWIQRLAPGRQLPEISLPEVAR
jgi:hypothetical protein